MIASENLYEVYIMFIFTQLTVQSKKNPNASSLVTDRKIIIIIRKVVSIAHYIILSKFCIGVTNLF